MIRYSALRSRPCGAVARSAQSALRLLHADLAHAWTVESLAAETGASRAALARRFAALVGQPPMTYLREQRLALAADLLREAGTTIATAAGRVGFSSAFALSAAFKKAHGIRPSEHRTGTGEGGSKTGVEGL
ncbi:hypothetical protein GCM10018965_045750 [Nonomuraea roseola]